MGMKYTLWLLWITLRFSAALTALLICVGTAAVLLGRRDADPGQIVFMRRAGFDASIYVLDTLHMTEQPLFTVPAALPADLPKLSSDGQRIAFELWGEGGLAIHALDANQNMLYATDPALQDRLPTWSPDGAQLAFWSNRAAPAPRRQRWQTWDFYVYDVTTRAIQPLTSLMNVLPFNLPLWSPDGRHILLNYWRPVVGAGMFIIDIQTGDLRPVDDSMGTSSGLVWSRDSTRIAFRANPGGNSDIVVLTIATGQTTNLTDHPANDFEPAWSPDGEQIAFTSNRDGRGDIFVMDADGANVRRVTSGGGWHPVWSPDGAQLAFYSNRSGDTAHYAVNIDGSNLRYLADSDQHTLLGWLTHNK